MTKLIIGIHGLSNKPEKLKLKEGWESAINEGIENIVDSAPPFDFKMVYWADLLYKYPVHEDHAFDFDELYNDEPYIKAEEGKLVEYKDSWKDHLGSSVIDGIGSSLDFVKQQFGMSKLTDWLLEKVLKDLAFYYDENRKINDRYGEQELAFKVLKDELQNCILTSNDSEIMVIAHSMGSIIAYDVLRDIGHEPGNTIEIQDLVTIGSPLGLPHVKQKIIEKRTYDDEDERVRTPSIITNSWTNFSDRKDAVAIDTHLKDDYKANSLGITVHDDIVINDYIGLNGEGNSHKSYGYLRTPELSKKVIEFLVR